MNRKAVLIDKNKHATTLLFVDISNAKDILPYIMHEDVHDEFKDIRQILRENLRIKDKYCKCDVSNKAKNMFEMRFTNKGRNDRIYCQEQSFGSKRIIILSELFIGKKTQDIPKKIKSRIETLGTHNYDLDY